MKKLTLSSLKASDLAANFRKTNLNDNKLIIRITKKLKEYNEIYFTGYNSVVGMGMGDCLDEKTYL